MGTRTAEITDDAGKVDFQAGKRRGAEIVGVLATKVVVSKYFYGDMRTAPIRKGGRETSVRQLVHRVTRTIADWGIKDGYFAARPTARFFTTN